MEQLAPSTKGYLLTFLLREWSGMKEAGGWVGGTFIGITSIDAHDL